MEKKLLTPIFRATIGNYDLTNGMAIEYYSNLERHVSWCKIVLDDDLIGSVEFVDGATASLELGYEDDFDNLIQGRAYWNKKGYQKEFRIIDGSELLNRWDVKASFLGCTPQDIVRYICSVSGITKYHLSDVAYQQRDIVVVSESTGIEAIQSVGKIYEIENTFFFWNGALYWNSKPGQEDVYQLQEEQNILTLEKQGETWKADIIGIPWVHVADEIEVEHEKFTGTGEVMRVMIKHGSEGSVKMQVQFREV